MVLRVEVWRAGQPWLEAEGEGQAGGLARVRLTAQLGDITGPDPRHTRGGQSCIRHAPL